MGRDITQDPATNYKKKFDNIPLIEAFRWADEVATKKTSWMPNGRDVWHDGDRQMLDDDNYKKAIGIEDWGVPEYGNYKQKYGIDIVGVDQWGFSANGNFKQRDGQNITGSIGESISIR